MAAPLQSAVPRGDVLEDHLLAMRDASDGKHPKMFHGIGNHSVFTVSDRYLSSLISEHGRAHQLTDLYDRAAVTAATWRAQASVYTPVLVELGLVPPAQWHEPPAQD